MTVIPVQFTCPRCGRTQQIGLEAPPTGQPASVVFFQCLIQNGVGCGFEGQLPASDGQRLQ
jgi:hypothetical protein